MLDACAPHATWIDVFCEDGAFDGEHTRAILEAGIEKGLTPRVHANQLHHGPGVQIAVELDAASADHVTHVTDADIDALRELQHRRHAAARRGVQHPRPISGRPPTDRRRRHRRPRRRLQPRLQLHDEHPVLHRDRRARDAHDARRGRARRHARRRAGARRTDIGRLSPGARADAVLLEAPEPHPPRLPARRPAGQRRLEGRPAADRQRFSNVGGLASRSSTSRPSPSGRSSPFTASPASARRTCWASSRAPARA